MGKKNAYGHDLSKRAEKDGKRFMDAQSSICANWFCTGLCSLIFSLIILTQLKKTYTKVAGEDSEYHGANVGKIEDIMKRSMWNTLFYLVFVCCLGSAMGALAHNFVKDKNMLGLRLCCVFENMAGVSSVCNGLAYCALFIVMAGLAGSMGSSVELCAHLSKINNTTGVATPVNVTLPEGLDCEAWVAHLKPAFTTMSIWLAILTFCTCKLAAFCFAGAKYAIATHDDFEDEEMGDIE